MPAVNLLKRVQDFLDAEIFLQQRRSECDDSRRQQERFDVAKRELSDVLTVPHLEQENKELCIKAKAYLASVADFEKARDANNDLAAPARRLEQAQCDLQAALYGFTRETAPNQCSYPKRLLVAVADDEQSRWAIAAAGQLAESLPARIRLIHVAPDIATAPWNEVYYSVDVDQASRRRSVDLLKRLQEYVPADIHCDTIVREGDAATEIVGAARRWGADFIIMGTRGRGRLSRFLVGSTAESVIRLAPCPVVTIGHAPFQNLPCQPDESNQPQEHAAAG